MKSLGRIIDDQIHENSNLPPARHPLRFLGVQLYGRRPYQHCLTAGFAVGAQAWTFQEECAIVLEAIDKTAEAGGEGDRILSGQAFSTNHPGVNFDHNASEEVFAAVKERLDKRGVRAVNCCRGSSRASTACEGGSSTAAAARGGGAGPVSLGADTAGS